MAAGDVTEDGNGTRFRTAISPIIIVRDGPRTRLILRTLGDNGLLRTLPDGAIDDEINAAVRAWEAERAAVDIDREETP